MVLDAGVSFAHPTVITGSHNWTNSAEVSNNENTLIVEDATIAGHYLQEFAARYYQFGGSDTIRVSVDRPAMNSRPRLPFSTTIPIRSIPRQPWHSRSPLPVVWS